MSGQYVPPVRDTEGCQNTVSVFGNGTCTGGQRWKRTTSPPLSLEEWTEGTKLPPRILLNIFEFGGYDTRKPDIQTLLRSPTKAVYSTCNKGKGRKCSRLIGLVALKVTSRVDIPATIASFGFCETCLRVLLPFLQTAFNSKIRPDSTENLMQESQSSSSTTLKLNYDTPASPSSATGISIKQTKEQETQTDDRWCTIGIPVFPLKGPRGRPTLSTFSTLARQNLDQIVSLQATKARFEIGQTGTTFE